MPSRAIRQTKHFSSGRQWAGLAAISALCGILAGCVETLADMSVADSAVSRPFVSQASSSPGALAKPALVSLASVDGAPAAIAEKFSRILAAEAMGRNISLADTAAPQYFLRGYLAATPGEGGVTLSWVWDVFDSSRHRIQRMADTLDIKGDTASGWSLVNDKALAGVATRSADDLAAILAANLAAMPEPVLSSADQIKPAVVPASAPAISAKPALREKTAFTDNYPVLQ